MLKAYKNILKKAIPIYKGEWPRFLTITALMFFIVYVHSITHIAKDVLIISHLGAESISALKLWGVIPASLLFMIIYIKLLDKLSRAQLFQVVNWFFIAYFILFAFVLYPYREGLSINFNHSLMLRLSSLKYFFKIISNWHYSLFYIFSEGWAAIMLPVAFWQIANHITTVAESKRFYILLGGVSGIGKLLAGFLSANYMIRGTNWQATLNVVTHSVIIAGVSISVCLLILERIVGKDKFNLKKNSLIFQPN